jgi:deazaflavin-dependent oxidoreductase (nitroreductase family)
MSDTTHDLTRRGLNAMAAEVGTEAGPGAITKEFNRALIDAFRANRGVVRGELQGGNFLLLTTTGAKSGATRTTPLVYHRIGGRLLIIASTGGGPRNPGWFDNLAKNPSVRVELGDATWEGRAVVLSGAERDALFAAVVKATADVRALSRTHAAHDPGGRVIACEVMNAPSGAERLPVALPLCLRLPTAPCAACCWRRRRLPRSSPSGAASPTCRGW